MKPKLANTFIGVAFLLLAPTASANIVEFTTLSSFDAAAPSTTKYDFSGLVPDFSFEFLPGNLKIGPVLFTPTSTKGHLFVIGAGYPLGFYGVPFLSVQPNSLLVNTAPTYAIAFDYGSYFNSSDVLAITFSTGDVFSAHLPSTTSTTAFIGFTSSVPITSVSFVDRSASQVLDLTDFIVGPRAAATPLPPMSIVFATGLLFLGGISIFCRKKRDAASFANA